MAAARLIGKLRAQIAARGWRDGGAFLLERLLREKLGIGRCLTYRFYCQPVPEAGALKPPRDGSVVYRQVTRDDPVIASLGLSDQILTHRFDQKATCIGAEKDGRLIGTVWFCTGAFREDEARCLYRLRPEGKTVWDFGVQVAPDHRLGMTFARLWQKTNAVLAAQGVRWSLSRISAYDLPSLAAHQRLGARVLGQVRILRLWGLQLMWGNIPPYLHLSLGPRSAPTFVLDAED